MPNSKPSSAPQADAPQPTDDLTAATVLRDDTLDQPVGGGALGAGAGVAGQMGAETPNSPLNSSGSAGLAGDSDAKVEAEARAQSVAGNAPEPGYTSR